MTHTEKGQLEAVLIAGAVIFGAMAIVCKLLALWLWSALEPQLKGDSDGSISAKTTRLNRQIALVQAGAALLFMGFVSAAAILKIGTTERGGHDVNWLYFSVGEAVAFALLGMIWGKFMWFDKEWQMYAVAGCWAAWPVLLGTASLLESWNSRLFCFLVAGAIVLLSLVITFFASKGAASPMFNNKGGLLATVLLACALVVYFVYWYIGFENRGGRPGVSDNTRWHAFLAWLFAGIVAHGAVPAILLWCWQASDIDVAFSKRSAVLTQDDVESLVTRCPSQSGASL